MLARGHRPHGLAGMIQAIALRPVDQPELLIRAVAEYSTFVSTAMRPRRRSIGD